MAGKKSGDGASGTNYKDICPVCGKERGENCKNVSELILCPNNKECGNNNKKDFNGEQKHVRKGCSGFLCGNIGAGPFLGSNIMVHTYKSNNIQRRADSDIVGKSSLKGFIKKIKDSNAEIIAAFKEAEVGDEIISEHKKDFAAELKKIRDKKNILYKYDGHPLYVGGGSIQAHHIICSEAMKDDKWRAICKDTGYNINCWKNGIFLPAYATLACHLGYPRHFGGHSQGRGEQSDGAYKSYVDSVKGEINNVSEAANSEVCKEKTTENFTNELNQISIDICNNIKDFIWTITWDGINYKGGISPRIGCAGLETKDASIGDKKNKLVDYFKEKLKEKELVYDSQAKDAYEGVKWRTANNDMETITELDGIDSVCCKRDHNKDFEGQDDRFDDFVFEVGN